MRLTIFFAPKKLWIFAAVFFLGVYVYLSIHSINSNNSIPFIISKLFITQVLILLAALILGLLIACVPYRQKKFRQKFNVTFPFASFLIAFALFSYMSYEQYTWWIEATKYGPLMKYESVEIPANLDCSSIHNGKFEDHVAIFERQGDMQIQMLKESNQKKEYKVEWTSDCEYQLINVKDSSDKAQVKVVAVTSEGFDCYAASGKYAAFYKCKRVK